MKLQVFKKFSIGISKKGFTLLLCIFMIGIVVHSNAQQKSSKTKNNSSAPTSNMILAASKENSVSATSTQHDGENISISFDLLGDYEYKETSIVNNKEVPNSADKVPQRVRALNGKKVSIRGYFYPVEIEEDGTIKDFMLLRNQISCCFGDAVQINEWISATMNKGKKIKNIVTSSIVTLYGTLEVGEKMENGCVSSLYRMKVDKVVEE